MPAHSCMNIIKGISVLILVDLSQLPTITLTRCDLIKLLEHRMNSSGAVFAT